MRTVRILLLGLLFAGRLAGESNRAFAVMSYNILRPAWSQPSDPAWSNRVGGIAQIVRDHKPGIVGVQEEHEEMVNDLLQRLPDYDYTFPVQPNGAGILFRRNEWKPVHLERRLTVDGRWITEALMEQAGGQRLYVYCLHLSPFEEWKRMMGAEILRQMIDARTFPDVPAVVLGDMNALDRSAPFTRLTEKRGGRPPLRDSFAALHPGEPAGFTADSYQTQSHGPDFRIDYILFSEGLTPIRHVVIHDQPDGFYPSDHLPVYAEFAW